MHSIVLKTANMPGYMLVERVHDAAETDYIPIIRLEEHEAQAIAGPHTGIDFLFSRDAPAGDIEKLPLRIEPVPDRAPGTRPWRLRIGDDLVMRSRDGEEAPVRLTDDHVIALVDYAHPVFPPGEPDWDRRNVEAHEEKAMELRSQAEAAQENAISLRAAWNTKQAENQSEPGL